MCAQCGWERFARDIDDMLEERRFRVASQTLAAIRDTVRRNRHATKGQSEAVENIRQGFDR